VHNPRQMRAGLRGTPAALVSGVKRIVVALALTWACTDEPVPLGPPVEEPHGEPIDAGLFVPGSPDATSMDVPLPTDGGTPLPAPDAAVEPAALYLVFGPDLLPGPRARIEAHLRRASADPVILLDPEALPDRPSASSLVLSFGDTAVTRAVLTASIAPEGFAIRSGNLSGARVFAVAGRGQTVDALHQGNLGLAFGSYALLEELGFAFLHPLEATIPPRLEIPRDVTLDRAPRWHWRGLQLHTMHPLELADLLNGWGMAGPEDEHSWQSMLPDWDEFLEWMVANGQNHVHWLPLAGASWREFANSPVRYARFAQLTARAHAFGIAAGADVALVQQQQHAWKIIEVQGDLEQEKAQIRARLDLLYAAGFDYIATENGVTEFTHGSDDRMLEWMNELCRHSEDVHGKRAFIKIHASTGQVAENHPDPRTGQPMNFNFLPHFADPRLGIMPHTVQHYSLDDPAPTYGNDDFSAMREFLHYEIGQRPVVWHPETSYWVSFDVDVPLFLPLYADRRLYDLRLIARGEGTQRMSGQNTFSSGWEWGYWVGEVITARAAVDPLLEEPDHLRAVRKAMKPVVRPFGPAADRAATILAEMAHRQHELLVLGLVNGVAPTEIARRNGQAYLQGSEAFDDLGDLARSIPGLPDFVTQPEKLGLVEMRSLIHAPPRYRDLRPLLAEMAVTFRSEAAAFAALEPEIPLHARPLFDDIRDASEMTALRAEQVLGLYDYADSDDVMALGRARTALDRATAVVAQREPRYRVPADRIAGWRNNPTAYEFAYLWTVRSLYYWWRDEAKAVDRPRSPCFMNIINPADIAMGEGLYVDLTRVVRLVGMFVPSIGSVAECLAESRNEPRMPPDGLRMRP